MSEIIFKKDGHPFGASVEVVTREETLDEILSDFKCFLLAVGYQLKPSESIVIEDSEDID